MLLKLNAYKKVIEAYDTKYGAVRANLTYEQLCRIRIPILPPLQLRKIMDHLDELAEIEKKFKIKQVSTGKYLEKVLTITSTFPFPPSTSSSGQDGA